MRTKNIIARQIALWLLYATDVSRMQAGTVLGSSFSTVKGLEPEAADIWDLIRQRVLGVDGKLNELNAEIQRLSPRWKVERMAVIDRNVLRQGIWEIEQRNIPAIVIINACVELAKTYGDKGSPAFVNGLLDQYCKEHDIPVE